MTKSELIRCLRMLEPNDEVRVKMPNGATAHIVSVEVSVQKTGNVGTINGAWTGYRHPPEVVTK